ncbi:DinB family protein [Marinomonas epiphytica]
MTMKSQFQLMAEYNQWMNNNIYQAASTLSQDDLKKDRGAFFGSILGVLNHITVGDLIWLHRFAQCPEPFSSLEVMKNYPAPTQLDAWIADDIVPLQALRQTLDKAIVSFIEEVTEQQLESSLEYHNTQGALYSKKMGHLLLHFFNHQTHHRGQVSTLLSQIQIDIGVTDLLVRLPSINSL